MTKQNFIALADVIIASAPKDRSSQGTFSRSAILELANFCESQNPAFNRQRWLDYIDGKCGKNGGKKTHNENARAAIAKAKGAA